MVNPEPEFRERWIKSRLNLDHHHPDVAKLESAIFLFCSGFAANPMRGQKLVIFGNNGVAKTKCCRAVKRWVHERKLELPLVQGEDLNAAVVECCMVNWAQRVDRMMAGDWDISHLISVPMAIIDDIGAEHDPTHVGAEKLYVILESREFKWTLITTNTSPDLWEEKFERRIADRLLRNSVMLDLSNVPSYSINT